MRKFTRMAWEKCALMVYLTLGLIGHGASYGQEGESEQNLLSSIQLYYWYDPRSVDHVKQLETLRMLAEKDSEPIQVKGLIAPDIPTSEVNVTPVLSAFGVGGDTHGDYAVLLTERGQIRAQGSGAQMERVLQSLPKGPVSTDIDESTWGKVKELFK